MDMNIGFLGLSTMTYNFLQIGEKMIKDVIDKFKGSKAKQCITETKNTVKIQEEDSKEKLLEEIDDCIKRYNEPPYGIEVEGTVELLERCRCIISREMHDDWIPIENGFPKEKGWYQCTCFTEWIWKEPIVRDLFFNNNLQEFIDNIRYQMNGHKDIQKFFWTKHVIAWKPLPESYKPEEETEDEIN